MRRFAWLLPLVGMVACNSTGTADSSPVPILDEVFYPADAPRFAKGMVSISFDDGWESQVTTVLPRFQARGWKGTFYLCPGWFGTSRDGENFMTADEAKQLVAAGQEIGDHTFDHQSLPRLTDPEKWTEINGGRDSLSMLLGIPASSMVSFATPYGAYDDVVLADSKKLFTSHRSGKAALNTPLTDPQLLGGVLLDISNVNYPGRTIVDIKALVEETAEERLWLLLVFHGVIDGKLFRATDEPVATFDEIMDAIAAANVDVVTVGDAVQKLKTK